jgi:hypothetical protein
MGVEAEWEAAADSERRGVGEWEVAASGRLVAEARSEARRAASRAENFARQELTAQNVPREWSAAIAAKQGGLSRAHLIVRDKSGGICKKALGHAGLNASK